MAYFLKHLTEETIALKRLLIPTEFVSKCGRLNLTNPVVLEPTIGNPPEVEVELYEDAMGFWLRNGWQEFADHYSLTHGHYLLFEYKSFSRFKIVILGANGVDVMCPASRFHKVGLNGNQVFPEAEQEEETRVSPVAKNMETNGGGRRQPVQPQSAEKAKQKAFMSSGKGRTADGGQRGNGSQFGRGRGHLEGIPEPRKENASTSSTSPSFFITISQCYMESTFVYVPIDFVLKHMKLEKSTMAVYGEDGSGPWFLSFVFRPHSKARAGRGRGCFYGGWPAFRNGNSLKPGDVCQFKLISSNEIEVTIQRN
ncbi:unnamed protein product [Linum tenue]|uniref:TF-B3 domain-containing protein n=1 Tax=Linum tenue TaxID=586396 RepID=A0AAV0RDC5_9ROSI|nr:unnamed protein product [Linum tenue]